MTGFQGHQLGPRVFPLGWWPRWPVRSPAEGEFMSYTYDARQDYAGADHLALVQLAILHEANRVARDTGKDRLEVLRDVYAGVSQPDDLVAVAEVWGGPGAGEEFRR